MIGIDEKFFAFLEHDGQIELVYWTNTEPEARAKVKEWSDFGKLNGESDAVHYGVACLVAEKKEEHKK